MLLPNWGNITVEKYQFINEVNKGPLDEVDKLIQIISILIGKTPTDISEMPLKEFQKLSAYTGLLISNIKQIEPRKYIKANGKKYYINYSIESFRVAQYVEIQHFLKTGIIENLHLIMASVVEEKKLFRKRKNNSKDHSRIADDLLKANFCELYYSAVFFCQLFAEFTKEYSGLFELEEAEEEETVTADFSAASGFNEQYGWIFSITQIAEHERVTLDQAYDLNVVQAFNDLAYLKAFKKHEKELNKQYVKPAY